MVGLGCARAALEVVGGGPHVGALAAPGTATEDTVEAEAVTGNAAAAAAAAAAAVAGTGAAAAGTAPTVAFAATTTGVAVTAAAATAAAAAASKVAATAAYGAAEAVLGAATSESLTPPSDGGFGEAQATAMVLSAAMTGIGAAAAARFLLGCGGCVRENKTN